MLLGVPTEADAARWRARDDSPEVVVWRPGDTPLHREIDVLVLPYMSPASELAGLAGQSAGVLQAQMLGYDGVAEHLPPGHVYCNAVGVHETPTAELVIGLLLADLRGIAAAARAERWEHERRPGLWGSRVLVVGAGGVARELAARLEPFEATATLVGRSRREENGTLVHGVDELPRLLPEHDAVVIAVPLGAGTRGLVDGAFLDRMREGALLVNVARGPVVDTEALVERVRAGRIRCALDVTDPEPLPEGHPLWTLPGAIVTPHVGGDVGSMSVRVDAVVAEQLRRLAAGEKPAHIVVRT